MHTHVHFYLAQLGRKHSNLPTVVPQTLLVARPGAAMLLPIRDNVVSDYINVRYNQSRI